MKSRIAASSEATSQSGRRLTAAGWQVLVLDSEFVGQRSVAIETHEAGMTVIRSRFRNVP